MSRLTVSAEKLRRKEGEAENESSSEQAAKKVAKVAAKNIRNIVLFMLTKRSNF